MAEAPTVVAVFGATALGKTEAALCVAEKLGAEIVVADSMQVYEGLPILTNQPDDAQRRRAPYHLVGIVPPQREFSVAEYARSAHAAIDGVLARGRAVVVEGGSGLYLSAALGDLDFAAAPDATVRADLERRWRDDAGGLLSELRRLDPHTAKRVDPANGRRVVRALEAVLQHGGPLSPARQDELWRPGERYAHRVVALEPDADRARLARTIDERVERMVARGALDEVERARSVGPLSRTALQAIGVAELCACLDGETTIDEATARMKARTRALARRQLTWMRKLPHTARVAAGGRAPTAVADDILALLADAAW